MDTPEIVLCILFIIFCTAIIFAIYCWHKRCDACGDASLELIQDNISNNTNESSKLSQSIMKHQDVLDNAKEAFGNVVEGATEGTDSVSNVALNTVVYANKDDSTMHPNIRAPTNGPTKSTNGPTKSTNGPTKSTNGSTKNNNEPSKSNNEPIEDTNNNNDTSNNKEPLFDALLNTISRDSHIVENLIHIDNNSHFTTLKYPKNEHIQIGSQKITETSLNNLLSDVNVSQNIIMGTASHNAMINVPSGDTIDNWDIYVLPQKLTNNVNDSDTLLSVRIETARQPNQNKFQLIGEYQYYNQIQPMHLNNIPYILVRKHKQ